MRACHQTPSSVTASTLRIPRNVLLGNLYFLVTASNTTMEGTAVFDLFAVERDPTCLTCGNN